MNHGDEALTHSRRFERFRRRRLKGIERSGWILGVSLLVMLCFLLASLLAASIAHDGTFQRLMIDLASTVTVVAIILASATFLMLSRHEREQRGMYLRELSAAGDQLRLARITAEMVNRDPLTDLLNVRGLLGVMHSAEANNRSYSLLLVDVDRFKRFNDRHGHVAGNDALISVAAILMACVRPGDTVARFGGEEFAIVLQDGSPVVAETVAKRVRSAIADYPWPVEPITCSVGFLSVDPSEIGARQAFSRADLAMYESKHKGRNRVTAYRPEMEERDKLPSRAVIESIPVHESDPSLHREGAEARDLFDEHGPAEPLHQ